MSKFERYGLSNELLTAIEKEGITEPTEIQESSILHIMEGKDVVGESATGSGKTLAFGCGIIERTMLGKGVQAVILTPTRELAEQVKDALIRFSGKKRLNIMSIYGGVAINPQIRDLYRAEVVVATPGRLLDHLKRGTINTSKVNLLVMDEADRMFDMGFIEDVEKIIQACPNRKQTLFFSATISDKIKSLAKRYMNNPVNVSAKNMVDPSKLKQVYYDVEKNMKLSLLVHLLKAESTGLVMVFCNTRRTTDFVVKNLKANKINAIAIHGGLSQNKRTSTIKLFNGAKVEILVCTDVAARGLHIDNVSHVYNYEIPNDPNEYVHRIGRTARAGEEGIVVNLICDRDHENFGRVQYEYRDFKIDKLERPRVERVVTIRDDNQRGGFRGNGGGFRGQGRNFRGSGQRGKFTGDGGRRQGGFGGNRSNSSNSKRRFPPRIQSGRHYNRAD
ncbi:MAG: DEAD/DEAH box helicase [Candidatus Woesearchaeota archaeon]